jgi:hypothetical protein
VKKGSRIRIAFALHVIFHERETISVATAAIASRCADNGRLMLVPSPHQCAVKYAEMPRTAAKESAVKSQRFQLTG